MKMDFEGCRPPVVTRERLEARRTRRQRNLCILLTAALAILWQIALWLLCGAVYVQNPEQGKLMAQLLLSATAAGGAVLIAFWCLRRDKTWQSQHP